jgi:hypothetical protein
MVMPLSREPFVLRMAIWLRGLERWYLVLGGVAVVRGFEPQSDLELSFADILIEYYWEQPLKTVHSWSEIIGHKHVGTDLQIYSSF